MSETKRSSLIVPPEPVADGISFRSRLPVRRHLLAGAAAVMIGGLLILAGVTGPAATSHRDEWVTAGRSVALTEVELFEQRALSEARGIAVVPPNAPSVTEVAVFEERELAEARAMSVGTSSRPSITLAEVLERRELLEANRDPGVSANR